MYCKRIEVLSYHYHCLVVCVTLGDYHQLLGVPIFPYDEPEEFKVFFQMSTIYSNYGGCHLFGWFKERKGPFAKGAKAKESVCREKSHRTRCPSWGSTLWGRRKCEQAETISQGLKGDKNVYKERRMDLKWALIELTNPCCS